MKKLEITIRKKLFLAFGVVINYGMTDNIYQYEDNESSVIKSGNKYRSSDDYFDNDASVQLQEEEIKALKNAFISPYNHLQDPIDLNMGLADTRTESKETFHLGTSVIGNINSPTQGQNRAYNTDIFQIWGQSSRVGGFALGAGGTAVLNMNQTGQPNTFGTTSVFTLSQAYIDYQYSNKLQITGGAILLTTPWVNSFGSNPGATYAMGNNPYQGVIASVQALPSLLLTGFYAWNYMQYPNNWFNQQTYYNTMGGPLAGIGSSPTNGPAGLGMIWNPVDSYSGQLWFYNFNNYAQMVYFDNSYHIGLSSLFSLDISGQGFMQSSSASGLTNQVSLPGETSPAGVVASNGVGGKLALNIGNNTTSISYNNIFGSSGSYLNGGMVTPYTYGMEIDPLYTTPALTSLAELGSGFAYTLRNSTTFMDNTLKFNLSFSQFFVNQVYSSQPNLVTEYDAALLYRIPHTNMNVWTRMVYQDQGEAYGGALWQPRVIFNWTY